MPIGHSTFGAEFAKAAQESRKPAEPKVMAIKCGYCARIRFDGETCAGCGSAGGTVIWLSIQSGV
jgi:hypothetical protein